MHEAGGFFYHSLGLQSRAPSRAKPTYVKNKNAEAMLLV